MRGIRRSRCRSRPGARPSRSTSATGSRVSARPTAASRCAEVFINRRINLPEPELDVCSVLCDYADETGGRAPAAGGVAVIGSMKSSLRRVVWLLPLVVLVASIGGAIQSRAATSTKYYSVTLSPSSIGRGATATVTVTLKNSETSTQSLGGANVTVPTASGLTGTSAASTVTSAGGKAWTVSATNPIELRAVTTADALPPGDSVS